MRSGRYATSSALLVLAMLVVPVSGQEAIWVEGESCQQHSMKGHSWYDQVVTESLSGGDWLSHFAGGDAPEATFDINVARAGDYHFWIRCNPVQTKLSYRWDRGEWQSVDFANAVERVVIARDGKPDLRFIAWVNVGRVDLSQGNHVVRFRFESRNNRHGAIDCFVLTLQPFQPRGLLKPGEKTGRANDGYFAWEPDVDSFAADALIDLGGMNEKVAGQDGRVRAEGNGFVLGNGTPVKFWAANAGPGIWSLDHQSHVYLARRLAKAGVNMVRLHGALFDRRGGRFDPRKLDQLQHLVQALKNEGIYTHLSFYFPLWFDLDGDQHPFMLIFFDRELQSLYASWADELLNTPNPYSGVPLGQDPAVAIVELVNEDSHFFWTFGKKNMPAARWQTFTKLYGDWLKEKYGSVAKAVETWGVREPGDDLAAGRVELYDAWSMTRAGAGQQPRRRARLRDQVEFLTQNMRKFNEQVISFLRRKCSYDGLVSCGNWHVTDPATLDALERYCYTAGDVIDHHGYFDHGHEGNAANYSVQPGQSFTSQSALHLQQPNPIPYVETEGYPHIISEIGWPMPNMYRAEFTFLVSAYGGLQGLDGVYSFALGSAGWDQQVSKFPVSTPTTLGCFPAAAVIFRKGYVQQSPTLVLDVLDLEDLYALEGTDVYVNPAYDQLRAPQRQVKQEADQALDPAAFYVGRIARSFHTRDQKSFAKDFESRVDRQGMKIRSWTDELILDYGKGVCTMNTAKAQGAAGFLGRCKTIALDDVDIALGNDYGTVTVVALDDRPLPESRKILIQCMTLEQFYGFKASGQGNLSGTIESVGSAPCGVQRLDGTITLRLNGYEPVHVIACDEHGYARDTNVAVSGTPAQLKITLDPVSVYHIVTR